MLFEGFRVSTAVVNRLYAPYLKAVARNVATIGESWDCYLPEATPSLGGRLSNAILRWRGTRRTARI